MSEDIYPDINIQLNKSRIDTMFNKRQELEKQLHHYKKIKKRWGQFDTALKVSGTLLAGLGTVAGAAVGAIGAVPIAIPIIIGSLTAGEGIVTSGLVIGLTGKKKSAYRDRINLIQSFLDRMFVYIEKARQDNIITVEELEGFNKLMEEYQKEVETGLSKWNISDSDYVKMKKEADKKVNEVLKNQAIESIVQSRLAAVYGAPQLRK